MALDFLDEEGRAAVGRLCADQVGHSDTSQPFGLHVSTEVLVRRELQSEADRPGETEAMPTPSQWGEMLWL